MSFFVAWAALCAAASSIFVAGATFGDMAKVLFSRIAVSGLPKDDTVSKGVAGAAFCECFEKCRTLRKNHTF